MNGKILIDGSLELERGEGFKASICPFASLSNFHIYMPCNDSCPLFGNPVAVMEGELQVGTTLAICQDRTLTFVEFTDLREANYVFATPPSGL